MESGTPSTPQEQTQQTPTTYEFHPFSKPPLSPFEDLSSPRVPSSPALTPISPALSTRKKKWDKIVAARAAEGASNVVDAKFWDVYTEESLEKAFNRMLLSKKTNDDDSLSLHDITLVRSPSGSSFSDYNKSFSASVSSPDSILYPTFNPLHPSNPHNKLLEISPDLSANARNQSKARSINDDLLFPDRDEVGIGEIDSFISKLNHF
jgi:hypothetical protein